MARLNHISCQPLAEYTAELDVLGVDLDVLVDGLDVTVETLRDPSAWLPWSVAAPLLERMERAIGGEQPWKQLILGVLQRLRAWPMVRLAVSPLNAYRLLIQYFGPRQWGIHRVERFDRDGRTLHVALRLNDEVADCASFFRLVGAFYTLLPSMLGMPFADVVEDINARSGRYTITLPSSMTLLARLRRAWVLLVGADDTVAAIIEQEAALGRSRKHLKDEVAERQRTEQMLRERDEQLQQAQKLEVIGHLAGGVAHDFNNLLMVMMGYSALLRPHVDPDRSEMLDEMDGVVERAAMLTAQLLSFGRREHVRPRKMNISDALKAHIAVFRRVISGTELRVQLSPVLATVVMDPVHLQQVVLNLVINARDVVGAGGFIGIGTAPDGDRVRLWVEDSGPGMSAAVAARIFEPFFTTKGEHGTGLGLSTVQAIVQEAGGEISVTTAPGEGARFDVWLPTVQEAVDPIWERARSGALTGSGTVVVVEDSAPLRRVLRATLEQAGFTVFTASGLDELERLLSASPGRLDAVVSDVMLGAERGLDAVTAVRAEHPDAAVLLISGFVGAQQRALIGQWPLLRKPFPPEVLLQTLSALLEA